MDNINKIVEAISNVTGLSSENIHIEKPENEQYGDYSTNIALQISSRGGTPGGFSIVPGKGFESPKDRALGIVELLNKDRELLKIVDKVEVAGPGFINFWLKKDVLLNNLIQIDEEKEKFGNTDTLANKKLMVEFAHPNTHKQMHIGHMRTLMLGESLSRLFKSAGADVFRANYQGDVGPHVAKAIWGIRKILSEKSTNIAQADKNLDLSQKAKLLQDGYVEGNKHYEDEKEEIDMLNVRIYQKDSDVMEDYRLTRQWSLDAFDQIYRRFYVEFDKLYFESAMYEPAKKIVEENIGKVFEKSEGAVIFDGEKYGLHKRVFITSAGTVTYEGKDMALAPRQYEDFPFDKIIHVVANEQKGYFEVVIKALELIDPKFKGREYHLPMGFVQLVGKKISSRTGEIVTVEELLSDIKDNVIPLFDSNIKDEEREEVAEMITIGAIKYSMLKVAPTSDVKFDLKESISLEGNSGPYLQYTYARTRSVLRKSEARNSKHETNSNVKNSIELNVSNLENSNLDIVSDFDITISDLNTEELALLRTFIHYPEVVLEAAEKYAPNLLCNYLYDLAQKFNTFYNKHGILEQRTQNKQQSKFRLAITKATGQILKNGLNLLGIEAPEKM